VFDVNGCDGSPPGCLTELDTYWKFTRLKSALIHYCVLHVLSLRVRVMVNDVIVGVLGQANVALTRWVNEGSILVLIRVARAFAK